MTLVTNGATAKLRAVVKRGYDALTATVVTIVMTTAVLSHCTVKKPAELE
jgi:hypothetical protein